MTINGKNYKYADMKNENIPNWYCLGDNTTYNTATWTSSDATIASVNNGVVKTKKAGKEGIYFRKGRTSRSRNVSREKGFVQLRPERPDRNCINPPDACSPRTELRSSM